MSANLDHLAERIKTDPHFLASVLDCWQRNRGWDDQTLFEWLVGGPTRWISREGLTRLQLCGVPRHRADVELIAERFGLDADRLAEVCGIGG